MFTKAFWRAVAERSLNTAWQAFAAAFVFVVGPYALAGKSIVDWPWLTALGVGAGAAVLAVLKGTVAGRKDGNPSIGSVEVLAKPGQKADPIAAPPVVVEPDPAPRKD